LRPLPPPALVENSDPTRSGRGLFAPVGGLSGFFLTSSFSGVSSFFPFSSGLLYFASPMANSMHGFADFFCLNEENEQLAFLRRLPLLSPCARAMRSVLFLPPLPERRTFRFRLFSRKGGGTPPASLKSTRDDLFPSVTGW